jgi:SAM-dependent methyltransferase
MMFRVGPKPNDFAGREECYRRFEEPSLRGHRKRSRVAAAGRLLGKGPGDLLEVRAGGGRLLSVLHRQGWTVWGVDSSETMVRIARAALPEIADRILVGQAEQLSFPDDSFDVVVCLAALERTVLDATLRELVRVVRPGGRLLIGLRSCRSPAIVWRTRVLGPVVRPVKRVLPIGRPVRTDLGPPVEVAELRQMLAALAVEPEHVEPLGALVLVDPLDRVAPRLALRAARRAERSARGRRTFGTQRLVLARKL